MSYAFLLLAAASASGQQPPIAVTNSPPPIVGVPDPGAPGAVLPPILVPPPSAPPPPYANVVRQPQLRTPLEALITPDDYPASALAMKQRGRVYFSLVVGPDGRVAACLIGNSSGSAALDSATCMIMRRRARFTPAVDSNGNPVRGFVPLHYDWKLP